MPRRINKCYFNHSHVPGTVRTDFMYVPVCIYIKCYIDLINILIYVSNLILTTTIL